MLENRPQAIDHRKRFIEFFSVPNKSSITEMKKTAV
jgi:hypothetical protein